MDFLGSLAQTETRAPAGDRSYLSSIRDRRPASYVDSEIPGFKHLVGPDGQADLSNFIPADQADESTQTGLDVRGMTRAEALRIIAQGQGVSPTSEATDEAVFKAMVEKDKKKKEKPAEPGVHFDFPGLQ